jgi:transposase
VKENIKDYNDAEAIAEASQRANMRFVCIKTVYQQDIKSIHCQRERLKGCRTALSNQVRGLLAEYGIVIDKGMIKLRKVLPTILEDVNNGLSPIFKELLGNLYDELVHIDERLKVCEQTIVELNKASDATKRLQQITGIGPITASALYAEVGNAQQFKNGRHLAAWMGLVPKQHSSGGKDKLLGISKRGNAYLRTLLIHGARSALNVSTNKTDSVSTWVKALKARSGHHKACVALANKMSGICWAILAQNKEYRIN